jgi:hypothetical protein
MNRNKWILTLMAVLMIGGTAGVLAKFKSVQRLGEPGVKTRPIPGSQNLEVVLPEHVLGYTAELLPVDAIVTNVLPRDTSFGHCRYTSMEETNFGAQVNVVLMGEDRTSLHKPQFCLTGAGWTINKTEVDMIHMEKPAPYDLPVIKLTVSGQFKSTEGRPLQASGVYVYWYVAEDTLSATPSGSDRMWSIARQLITTGILQRWAYVSYFSYGPPGSENELYARMKTLITASVPEFQLIPKAGAPVAENKP